jgi:hypothetical protein
MPPNKEQRERLKQHLECIDDLVDPVVDVVELPDNALDRAASSDESAASDYRSFGRFRRDLADFLTSLKKSPRV